MRAFGLINFALVTGATACLMGVVTNAGSTASAGDYPEQPLAQLVLPSDTPEVELLYDFKDNKGNPPQTDPKSKLYLENPSNVKTDVEYNPATGNYDISQKVGDLDYRPDTYMNMKEYQDYMFKKSLREYWRSRVAADELNNAPRKGINPKLQVNSELFDRIFGGNTVDIKPTGTAELIFGLNRNKNFNPAIPQRQQKITNFDFNMRIQLNLIGKIGEKLKVTTNYNTEASFDWENQVKLDYTGLEDEILKKIEAGNVALPLNSSLISGSQTLFGFKTEMQFGRLRATTIFSQQKGKKQEVTVQGGAQTQIFQLNGDNYEQNKHFFLGHYFRNNYDSWMKTLPVINTPIVITRVEVYILNINGNAEQTRNVVAFQDLGEGEESAIFPDLLASSGAITPVTSGLTVSPTLKVPHNDANNLYSLMTHTATGFIRNRTLNEISALSSTAYGKNVNNTGEGYMDASRDFNIIQNARKLNPQEFYFNPRTGYISLNQQISNEQAVAVSYQYTYGGKTYQVGEFSDQITDQSKWLVCKLLKSVSVSVKHPMWKLMMKNVYSIGAYNLNPQDFKLDVFYNNIETGVDVPYLPFGSLNGIQLIKVLGCDRLSVNGDRTPDGIFDFIQPYTVLATNGRVYFPTIEPFGRSLEAELKQTDQVEKEKYIFRELYDSTRTAASFIQNKNRFKIRGSYKSASGSEIALNALNIPQGAVMVTANGVALAENTDYTVDYTLGRVKIINEGILNSGAQIKVSLESNSLFNVQQRSLWGTRLDYNAGRNLKLGGTFLRFNERPITQKVSIGDEPVSNIVAGLDFSYKTEAPFITRILDKLPFYSTKEMSTLTFRGEVAKLFPGNARAIGKTGNSYIDDFEGSISLIDVRNPNGWFLSSIPHDPALFPESTLSNDLRIGMNRARLNWYSVDQMFTRQQAGYTPSYYNNNVFSNNMWRQVFETELFPGKTPPNGQQVVLPVLDIGFYPTERGPYNYDVKGTNYSSGVGTDGRLLNPKNRWGGIMRRLETNDFQAANIEYIQFWLMDPYNDDYKPETHPEFDPERKPIGDLYINLGNISEDVLKDGRMGYENGLPGPSNISQSLPVDTTNLAIVPLIPPTVNAFSQDNADRPSQDVGYDGMSNETERKLFAQAVNDMASSNVDQAAKDAFINDPSTDDYHFFRGDDYDNEQANTIKRYSKYNNMEGNTPTPSQYENLNPNGGNYPTASANLLPNIEDVNRDNTMSAVENYYQYRIKISPQDVNEAAVGTNYLVDVLEGTADFGGVNKKVKWYQFKVPINQFENVVGGIEGFNSIRFMRVFLKGFERPVLLRMARFELVRSDWRRYQYDLSKPGEYLANDDNTTSFDVSAVSLQENGNKTPVNYVLPPDIQQQQNVTTTNLVLQNEQALQIRVCNLKDGDSRAIFKNVDLDTRMFENIKMNVHAEKLNDLPLNDGDLTLFFRVGTDYNSNYYEYEIPLKLTPKGVYDPNSTDGRYAVWPAENEVNFKFSDISFVKQKRNEEVGYFSNLSNYTKPYARVIEGKTITIVGNPNLGTIKSIMVGIRNTKGSDALAHCAEVWINELRLTDFNNKGGWATTGQMQAKLADLGQISLAGTYFSPFWGSVEKKINERSRESNKNWDVSASLNAGKFFPSSLKITLPVFYNFGRQIITPLFNPLDPDVRTEDLMKNENIDAATKDKIRRQTLDFTERKGFNVTNVRIDGLKRKDAKPMPWDVRNFTATYAYTEVDRSNVNVEYNIQKTYRAGLQYAYSIQNPLTVKPLGKVKALQGKWFTILREFNVQLMPNSFSASMDVNRNYNALKNRDITGLYAGSAEFANPALINKTFLANRAYNMQWTLIPAWATKFTYAATNESRIFELPGEIGPSREKDQRDTVMANILKGGENTTYRQNMDLNLDFPINKIPIFDFIKPTYRYSGTYTWQRRPFAAGDSIGNIIQNTNSHNFTANFQMVTLYNKIPYFKRLNTGQKANSRAALPPVTGGKTKTPSPETAMADTAKKKNNENFKDLFELLARGVMMLKTLNATYQRSGGQALPNFMPTASRAGLDPAQSYAPGFMFTTGLYDPKIRERSVDNGWLSKVQQQTTAYTETYSEDFSYRATVEPHGSLRIDLRGNRKIAKNISEYLIYDDRMSNVINDSIYKGYNFHVSKNETGSFNISTFCYFRTFQDGGKGTGSKLFNEFLAERRNVARELSEANDANAAGTLTYTTLKGSVESYYDGYQDNQQDVLIGAFYNTYTGNKIKNYSTKNFMPKVPIPNWNVTWDGLGKIPVLKKTFRSITVRHGYTSTYNVGGFSNNLLFRGDEQTARMPVGVTSGNTVLQPNFVSYYNINAVTITEAFTPLLKFDFQFLKQGWTANVETKRDKTTSLNVTGPQIIETKGQEYILGIGYMYPKLRFKNLTIAGKVLESNLTVKLDVSYRKNLSIIRRVTDGISIPTGGTDIITLRSSADYQLTPNINLRLFYDWIKTIPQTSASFPTSNATGGFSLRINFQ